MSLHVVLAYVAMSQNYLGGIFRQAAQRLGIRTTAVGPAHGRWLHDAPEEPGWEPDVVTGYAAPHVMSPEFWGGVDALINVDQGDGFYIQPPGNVPTAHCFTESNPTEHRRAVDANAIWSGMPHKPEGKATPGLLHLDWGYNPVHTPIDAPLSDLARPVDFTLHGSWSEHRNSVLDAVQAAGLSVSYGPPRSREAWGKTLCEAKMTLVDHNGPFLSGRVVDAMAAGCVVLSPALAPMDILSPRGYVPVPLRESDGRVDPEAVARIAGEWVALPSYRHRMAERARTTVAGLTWENQLLRVLGSIGVRLPV